MTIAGRIAEGYGVLSLNPASPCVTHHAEDFGYMYGPRSCYLRDWVGGAPPAGSAARPVTWIDSPASEYYCRATGSALADINAEPVSWPCSSSHAMEWRSEQGEHTAFRLCDGRRFSERIWSFDYDRTGSGITFRCAR